MALEYFPCFYTYRDRIKKLTDEEVGRLFRALMEYGETGIAKELDGREAIAFDFIAEDIDRAKDKYNETCVKNSENAKKRAQATASDRYRPQATATDRMPSLPTASDRSQTETESKTESKTECKENPPISPRARNTAFEKFWSAYPNKKSKGDAEKAFTMALKKTDLETILAALEKHKTSRQWQEDNGRFIPYPATWLNQERWSDVLEVAAPMHTLAPTAF